MNTLADLQGRIPDLMLRDQRRLRRRIDGMRRVRDRASRQSVVQEIAGDVEAAERRVAERRAAVPVISYPPISRSASTRTTCSRQSGTTRS